MQYVTFGKTGLKVSRLGFGCMRFPTYGKDGKTLFDYDESIRMLHRAEELGVNYFDTAPGYCEGESEIILGRAFKGRREKVFISTKNPIENSSGDDYEKRLEKSLKKLDTDYIDFYHFWGINLQIYIEKIDVPDGPLSRALKLKSEGVLRHISFSFHDKPENMIEIMNRGKDIFSSLLCQYNLLDRSNEKGIDHARNMDMGVVVMGPVGGGRLGAPSSAIQKLIPGKVQSTAETALRFVLNNPGVHIALSGMSSMQMVEENCRTASNHESLTNEETKRINDMLEENKRLMELYCTGCNYCMPCPQHVNIPEIFRLMNYHRVYNLTDYARSMYKNMSNDSTQGNANASACIQCGLCEKKCPQKIKIIQQLKQSHSALS